MDVEDLEELAGFIKVPCSFCGGSVVYGHDEQQEPAVLHTTPFCPRFDVIETLMEAVDFLAENRRKLGIPDPPEPS